MWSIYESKLLIKHLKKAPAHIVKHYELWQRLVEHSGPVGLRNIKGYHDEALKGEWKGYRSSRFGIKWRIIYKVVKGECLVYVIDVNPHKY